MLYSRIAYKRFDDWRSYFFTTSVGASGLAFAIKVWYSSHNLLYGMYAIKHKLSPNLAWNKGLKTLQLHIT